MPHKMGHNINILVVEDDEANRMAIRDILNSVGYSIDLVENGIKALEKLKENTYELVITDLIMPEMRGEELINNIQSLEYPPMVLVQSVITDLDKILELMRKGAYDYIPKPYTFEEFLHRVKLAAEVAQLRKVSLLLEKERQERLQEQLEWNLWREKRLRNQTDVGKENLISSLRTSFSQSSGLGSLVTLIQQIKKKSKEEGDFYVVPKKLMDLVFSNTEVTNKFINFLEEMDYLYQNELNREIVNLDEFSSFMEDCIKDSKKFSRLKQQNIKFSKGIFEGVQHTLNINKDYLKRAFQEILINAFKFSKKESTIYIIFEVKKEFLKISFLSEPLKTEDIDYTIQEHLQSKIFEPFFRATKHVFEEYAGYDFGIGLTFVDLVIQKHKGKITSYMVKSHLNPESTSDMVNIEIELPYES